jgi:DNA-binding LytR/AlgR family response regulator
MELRDIDWLTTYGNYVQIHSEDQVYLKRVTMKEMEIKLDNSRFARIHRSHIVNKNIIEDIHYKGGKNTLITICGTLLPIGRSYKNNLKDKDSLTNCL